jgi:hypothetical protein
MKTQINLKSAFCGLALGILIMLALGAGTYSNEIGRYQIATEGNIALVIDTKTGQVWAKGWQSLVGFNSDTNFSDPKINQPPTP